MLIHKRLMLNCPAGMSGQGGHVDVMFLVESGMSCSNLACCFWADHLMS